MNENPSIWKKLAVVLPWSLLVSFTVAIVPFTARFNAAEFSLICSIEIWPEATKFVVYTIPAMPLVIGIFSISIFLFTIFCAYKAKTWSSVIILILFCNWILWAMGIFYYLALNAVRWSTFI